MNASMAALRDIQAEFEGVAESLGIESEEDVVKMVKDIRKEGKEKRMASKQLH